ncbi:MAG TPA: sulfotransferase [Steroidobacteraceae bacterium]|jgi:tetratricopeptide (TPR) repeat protein|nr:sulfotransferase [Steroidobacteraceae bacterium]
MDVTDPAPAAAAPAAAATPAAQAPDVARIRALLREHKFEAVLAAAAGLRPDVAGARDGLLCVAIAQRYLHRIPAALQTLATLERHHPRFSRLYEERGRCFVELRQAPQAIEAFLVAVNINHALPGSWSMLEGLYRLTGQPDNLRMAGSHVATLRSLPQPIVVATGLFADGDLDGAEALIRAWLLEHGDHIEAMRLLARIGIAHKVYDDAELLLAAVLQLAPDYRIARQEYAGVLVELHRYEQARGELDRLLRDDPDNRALRTLYAASAVGIGGHERAIGLYEELLTGTPADAEVHLSIGHALKTLGRTPEAIESYRRAAACRPDYGDAYWSLANLKTYRFAPEEFARVRAALAAPATGTFDRYHLCFALAKALEDQGEFAESFRCYELGNQLKRPECRYRPEIIESNTRQQIRVCTGELFASRHGWGSPSREPIFIVGLPRSGSTLLEQILASHSQVEGTQELPNIQQMVTRLRGRDPDPENPRYPPILASMRAEEFKALGEEYLAATRIYRTGRAFFIDKMPNNFRHLGLIHLMLPNARIIDARREPMACCFSNLKQLFAQGQEFTYSVDDIARYYRTYLELMRHWDRVLPAGRILRVHHEDVVEDLEGSVRRILEYCGLDFEPQCISFHETRRSVRTASSEQVRQAIYREGLDQWRHFEPWLGPLRAALGDALTRYRDEDEQHETGSQRSVPVR